MLLFQTSLAAADNYNLSLECNGVEAKHRRDKNGNIVKIGNAYETTAVYHIRDKVLNKTFECKYWTDDKIICTNEIIVIDSCVPTKDSGFCLKIDRYTGKVVEMRKYTLGATKMESGFFGTCRKIETRRF